MEVAHISVKRSSSSRSVIALLWSSILNWLLPVPQALITGAANQVVELVPNKHSLFNIIGEVRVILSFLHGFIKSASAYQNIALGQRIPCPPRPVFSKQLKVKLLTRV